MDSYMIEFHDMSRKKIHDLQVPAFLTCNELVKALNSAYELGIDTRNPEQTYLRAENPVALIAGEGTLEEIGISNGTAIYYEPR